MKPGDFEDISVSKILHFAQGAGLLNVWDQRLQSRWIMVKVHMSLSACPSVFYSVRFEYEVWRVFEPNFSQL